MPKAKKTLGQHFLFSKPAIRAMVIAGCVYSNDNILEIGPGKGVLTEALLATGVTVIAVEKDTELVVYLVDKFKKYLNTKKLQILERDILNIDIENDIFHELPYKIIANIPYYITGSIVRKFLDTNNPPQSMTLLVQYEVARRMVAQNNKESILSLSVKFFGTPVYIKKVLACAFNPVPRVHSAIITIKNITPLYDTEKKEWYFKIIKKAFVHKRKQAFSNLSVLIPADHLLLIFENNNISRTIRAEDISFEKWLCITEESFVFFK